MEEKIPTDLIVRYLSNEASTEEAEHLLNWVAADSLNQKIFADWMENWKREISTPDVFDLQHGLAILNERVDEHEKETIKNKSSFTWIKIAASVMLLISSTALFITLPFNRDPGLSEYKEYYSPAGRLTTIILHDNTKVTLNENTTLKYPAKFTDNKREVILEGEAFFEVTKDSNRPFFVHTGELATKVLGTSFNIQTLFGTTTIAVATGKVMVSKGTSNTFLLPEEQVTYSAVTKKIIKGSADLESVLAWSKQELIFRDTPLSEVAILLEKKYHLRITFEKETLKRCLITGKFKNQSLEKILEAISYSTGIGYKRDGIGIKISGNGCDQ